MKPTTNTEPTRAAKAILDQLLTLPADQRSVKAVELCRQDPALKREVEHLLRHADDLGDFLEQPVGRVGVTTWDEMQNGPPVRDYRLLRQIGQGGMGTVYLAEKITPDFEQRVALKVLRPEIDEAGRMRFRLEGRILACLEHPNIARLIDAGLTEDGRPFLAMEYVEGDRITAFSDRHRLTVGQRIELVLKVCDAVQYAHQNMILHRDLKPSNILVTGEGVPKLVDFGIAKLLTAESLTAEGTSAAMTPDFASPEQIRGETLTAATDVYSLGVLLYRLLTGKMPNDRRGRPTHELVQALEADPQPTAPSDAVSGTTRHPDRRQIRGDLDAICLKALGLEPGQRYESAAALADDLRRFMANQPVRARDHSWRYALIMQLRRHRLVAALTLALLAAVGILGAMSITLSQRLRSEHEASLREQARTEIVKDLLMEALQSTNPMGPSQASENVEQILDGLARRIRLGKPDDPTVQAEVLLTLGSTNAGLGRGEQALTLLNDALKLWRDLHGEDHPKYAATLLALGRLWTEKGDFGAARTQLVLALEILQGHPQASSRDIASCQIALAWAEVKDGHLERGEQLVSDALDLAKGWTEDEITAEAWDLLGSIRGRQGNDAEAESYMRRGLRIRRQTLGETHSSVSVSLNNLAGVYQRQGHFNLAEQHFRQALEIRRQAYPPGHPHIVHALSNLGSFLHLAGKLEESERVLDEALQSARQSLGEQHLFTVISRNNLAAVVADRGKFDRAEALGRENTSALAQLVGEAHHYVSLSRSNVAWYMIEQGQYDEAEPLLEQALVELIVSRGEVSTEVAQVRSNLGVLSFRRSQFARAAEIHQAVLELRRELFPEDHPDLGRSYTYLAKARAALGQYPQAREAANQALRVYTTTLTSDDWRVAEATAVIGDAIGHTGQRSDGAELLREAVERLEQTRSAEAFETRWARQALSQLESG